MERRPQVILLPGAVLPAAVAYEALIAVVGDDAEVIAKDLELYTGDEPPPGNVLEAELDGILRVADEAGLERFHLGGYSAGGAAALYFTAAHPERVRSLALLEPAWAGNEGLDPAEQAVWREYDRIMTLPAAEQMPSFVRMNLAPEAKPPPPPAGPPPPWMAKRPAGLAALTRTFRSASLDLEALRSLAAPVYYALGRLSNPDQYGQIAKRLNGIFSEFSLEVFEDRHHFDPPHRIEPERLATSLLGLWKQG